MAPARRGKRLDETFAHLELSLSLSPQLDDFRQELPGQSISLDPNLSRSSGGAIQILSTEFRARVAALEMGPLSSHFYTKLPFRSLAYTRAPTRLEAPSVAATQGSEFGGFEGGLSLALFKRFFIEAGYADFQSEKLRLFRRGRWIAARLLIENREALFESQGSGLGIGFRLGGGQNLPLADADASIDYGRVTCFDARFFADAKWTREMHFMMGADALFRRAQSFFVSGHDTGGAGLATVSPFLTYELLEDLWIGARWDLPLFRPQTGREDYFGETGAAGLLGKQFSFTLSASTF